MTPLAVVAHLLAGTPTPSPEAVPGSGPGIVGFLVTFALVVVCIPLFLSMTRKVRGVRYRDEQAGADDGAEATGGSAAAVDGRP